jgi:asparagine synthase (glutamine-hydrolysing)
MCGILGYIGSNQLNKNIISNSLEIMKNRGPDNQNCVHLNLVNKNIYFFHSRLSILDINSRSNQPFKFKNLLMIYNGEIYNYLELKKDLEDKGYKFETSSDTEVLIKCYYEYGDKAFTKFNGMWSLGILNLTHNYLKLSRDYFGEKPLFFHKNTNEIIFGSEIKYIKSIMDFNPEININLLKQNLFLGYKSLNYSDSTFYKNITKIPQCSIYKISFDGKFEIKKSKFYNLASVKNFEATSPSLIKQEFEKIFLNAIKIRLRSDVPIGFCLSGGIDSSLLASVSQNVFGNKIKTFSIVDRDDRYNEYLNIKKITKFLGCENHIIKLKKKNFLENMNDLCSYHDEPIATISYFVHSFLLKKMKEHHIKVSISGTGADELFTGYYHHFLLYLNMIKKPNVFQKQFSNWKKNVAPLIRDEKLKNLDFFKSKYLNDSIFFESKKINNYFSDPITNRFEEKKYFKNKLKNRMQNELLHEIVPIILRHDDLNSMYHSIENRSPYLDKNLLSFARSINDEYLIDSNFQKKILRDFGKKFLPKAIYSDNKKIGFNASIESLIDLDGKQLNDFLFSNNKSILFDIVKKDELKKLLKMKKLPNYLSKFLFSVISTKFFLEKNGC